MTRAILGEYYPKLGGKPYRLLDILRHAEPDGMHSKTLKSIYNNEFYTAVQSLQKRGIVRVLGGKISLSTVGKQLCKQLFS